MKPKYHDYQKLSIDFCMRRLYEEDEAGVGLFLDPGLGKTLITLAVLGRLRDLGEIGRVLIVAPLRVCRLVWRQESSKWGFNFSTNMLCQRVKRGLKDNSSFIDLINPESLHLLVDHADRYDVMIIDESTKFKSWSVKRTRSMRKIAPRISKRIILTGTPAPNSLADLHAQCFILDGGAALGRNVTVFRSLYMYQGGFRGREWALRDGQADKINTAIRRMVLRLDAETNLDMPELYINNVYGELPKDCVREYKNLKRELLAQLVTGDILAMNAASAYMKMRQFCNGSVFDSERVVHKVHKEKVNMFTDLVSELGGKPVLGYYQFSHDVEALKKEYPKAPVLNGKTKTADAERMLDEWNAGKTHVFLVQNQAASHGLNMQGSGGDVVYFGLNPGLEVYEQSYRRIYRQGVTSSQVRIHRLLMQGTVDTLIADKLDLKDKTQRDFLNALRDHAEEG